MCFKNMTHRSHVTFPIKEDVFVKRAFPFLFSVVRVKMAVGVPLFRQFLVVKVCERIQDICITECSGCQFNHRFAALHPCQKLSLTDRVDMFLPQVVDEALNKMEKLIATLPAHFKFTNVSYMQEGVEFLQQLTTKHLFDRRFINEDTALMFEYDDRWYQEDMSHADFCEQLLDACEEIDKDIQEPNIKKRKANPNVRNVDEIERIADIPRKPRPTKAKK